MKKYLFFLLCVLFGLSALNAQSVGHKYLVGDVLIRVFGPESMTEFNVAVETWNTKCGLDNGQLFVYIEGGQPPYVVKVDGQIISSPWELKNLSPGFRRVDVDDQAGNKYSLFKAQIDPSSAPVASLVASKENCGKKDATVTVTVTGGKQQGMFFNWVGPNGFKSSLKDIYNLGAGTYTVIVTDGDFCTETKTVEVVCDKPAVLYSGVMTKKVCDSLKTLKLDTVSSGKSVLGQDSFTIFKNVFAKTYFKNVQTYSCNPLDTGVFVSFIKYTGMTCDTLIETKKVVLDTKPILGYLSMSTCDSSLIGQVKTGSQIFMSHSGCDSMNVITYFSGFAFKTITQVVCTPTAPYYLHIPRNGLCDSVVRVVPVLAPTPTTKTQTEFSCFPSQPKIDTIKTIEGCDAIYIVTNFVVRQKLDTTRLNIFVCGLKKSSHREFNLTNRFGCDSLVVIDSLPATSKTMQLPLTRTCEKSLAGNFIDTLFTQYGCDSIVKWSVAYVPSTRKVNVSFQCDKSQAGVFPKFFQNQYGCDSIIVDSVVYAGSNVTLLPVKEFCGTKSSDTVFDTTFSNIYGCDSVVRQHVIETPSVKIQKIETKLPVYGDGSINILISGGTAPFTITDENGKTISLERFDLSGGLYPTFIEDSRGCKADTVVALPSLAIVNEGGEYFIVGGHATPEVIKILGGHKATYRVVNTCGKVLDSGVITDAREEIRIRLNVPNSETFVVEILFPKFRHFKKSFKS